MQIFDSSKIKFSELTQAVQNWLVLTYKQTSNVFSKASPFGQILHVLNSYIQLIWLYLEDIVVESNILTASKRRSIWGLSRLTGHSPFRSLSARGTISLSISKSADIPQNANFVHLKDKCRILCNNNSQDYFISLPSGFDSIEIDLKSSDYLEFKIIQGQIAKQTLIGNGKSLQSYFVNIKDSIDHNLIWVTVNGIEYKIEESLYDMNKDTPACIIKTGISGGIDIYFGDEDRGKIPPFGSSIEVIYVKSSGENGNILSKSNNITFKFLDNGILNTGEDINLNEIFNISLVKPVLMGAEAEDINLTKLIAPKTSKSFVLSNTDAYVYLLSKFNYSLVDAYTNDVNSDGVADDNIVHIFILPDIIKKINSPTDYFTVPLDYFYLDESEKLAIAEYIDLTGQQMIGTEIDIVDPIIKKYVTNIFLRVYDNVEIKNIKNNIIEKLSQYFLSVKRRDKIPKSDLVAIIENVPGVDSVAITFISEENEKAILNGSYQKRIEKTSVLGLTEVIYETVKLKEGEDPQLGLDSFGDIDIGKNETPIIRGNFNDRWSNWYEDTISDELLSSVNIFISDTITDNLSTKIRNSKKSSIK